MARGRTQTRRAVALLLVPHFMMPVRAFLAGNVGAGGVETVRLIVWIGFVYLVYLGFRLIRVIVVLYAMIVIALGVTSIVRAPGHPAPLQLLLGLSYIALMAVGLGLVIFDPAVRAFFTYQRGGKVPYPPIPEPPRGLTRA